jgi:hypothetical protein
VAIAAAGVLPRGLQSAMLKGKKKIGVVRGCSDLERNAQVQ